MDTAVATSQTLDIQTVSVVIQTVLILVQTMLGVVAIYLAFKEVREWRVELIGSKKIEVILNLRKLAVEVGERFEKARSSDTAFERGYEFMDGHGITKEQQVKMLLEPLRTALDELIELRWELSTLLTKTDLLGEQIQQLSSKYAELQWAVIFLFEDRFSNVKKRSVHIEDNIAVIPTNSEDIFGEDIKKIIKEILIVTESYIRS